MATGIETLGSVATAEQREALASPLRLEVFGHFTSPDPLSVRELADRMGRSRSSLYYHVHRLVAVGLLREAGRRGAGAGAEALYARVGSALRLEPDGSVRTRAAILRTMGAAFRMAERDLEAALPTTLRALPIEGGPGAASGEPAMATRLHFRASREVLEEVRDHLVRAVEALERAAADPAPTAETSHWSLTLALLPLRGREPREGS